MKLPGFALTLFVWFTLCTVCAPPALATDHYVAPNGSDSGPGTILRPYATAQKAYTVSQAGDRIIFRAGTYPCYLRLQKPSLTVMAFPGEQAILQFPAAPTPAGYGMVIWVQANGCTIGDPNNPNGLILDGQYTGQSYYCYYALKVDSSATVQTCSVYDCTIKNAADADVKLAAPLNASTSTNPGMLFSLTNCTIYKDPNTPELRDQWTLVDSLAPGTQLENCTIYQGNNGVSLKGGVDRCSVAGCSIHDIKYTGVWLGAYDNSYVYPIGNPNYQSCLNAFCTNNTIARCGNAGIVLMGAANANVSGNTITSCGGKAQAALWLAPNLYYTTATPTRGRVVSPTITGNRIDVATGTYVQGSYTWQRPAVEVTQFTFATTAAIGVWSGNLYSADAGQPLFWSYAFSPYIVLTASPGSSAPPVVSNFSVGTPSAPPWIATYMETGSKVGPSPVPVGGIQ